MAAGLTHVFRYIAFDDDNETALAYGSTAVEALRRADLLAPGSAIYILNTGYLGLDIWNHHMTLTMASKVIEAPLPSIFVANGIVH